MFEQSDDNYPHKGSRYGDDQDRTPIVSRYANQFETNHWEAPKKSHTCQALGECQFRFSSEQTHWCPPSA
jgi:hypothetical protein